MTASSDYIEEIERWRTERLAKLAADDGWLNLIGRWDLEPATVTIGSAAESGIVLPVGPERLGTVTEGPGGDVVFVPAAGGEVVRVVPEKRSPPRFHAGRFLFEIVTIGGRSSLRVRDREHRGREAFAGINYFDVDEAWRIVAEWIPLDQPVEAEVKMMIGTVSKVTVTHKAAFTRDGARYELLPSYGTPQSPQFVIRDSTAGTETYPASRFLYGEGIENGTIVLDFNKAINPPCAFTDFAVCPLPPPQNVLPFRVPAGELKLRH